MVQKGGFDFGISTTNLQFDKNVYVTSIDFDYEKK